MKHWPKLKEEKTQRDQPCPRMCVLKSVFENINVCFKRVYSGILVFPGGESVKVCSVVPVSPSGVDLVNWSRSASWKVDRTARRSRHVCVSVRRRSSPSLPSPAWTELQRPGLEEGGSPGG